MDEIKTALYDLVSGKYDKGALEASKELQKEDGINEAAVAYLACRITRSAGWKFVI